MNKLAESHIDQSSNRPPFAHLPAAWKHELFMQDLKRANDNMEVALKDAKNPFRNYLETQNRIAEHSNRIRQIKIAMERMLDELMQTFPYEA